MTNIVIVNDGQTRWAADKDQLFAALDRLGWEKDWRDSSLWREPPKIADDVERDIDPVDPYTDLCQIVQPCACEEQDDAGHGTFSFHQDLGAWMYSDGEC